MSRAAAACAAVQVRSAPGTSRRAARRASSRRAPASRAPAIPPPTSAPRTDPRPSANRVAPSSPTAASPPPRTSSPSSDPCPPSSPTRRSSRASSSPQSASSPARRSPISRRGLRLLRPRSATGSHAPWMGRSNCRRWGDRIVARQHPRAPRRSPSWVYSRPKVHPAWVYFALRRHDPAKFPRRGRDSNPRMTVLQLSSRAFGGVRLSAAQADYRRIAAANVRGRSGTFAPDGHYTQRYTQARRTTPRSTCARFSP
jgi:hypothetical protein